MAITAIGFDGTVNEADFSKFMRYVGDVAYRHGVPTGLTVTTGAGTRESVVAAGIGLLPGVLADSDDAVTLTHAANSGSGNRADYVVLRGDWSDNSVVLTVKAGTSSTPPALTQDHGSVWEMPLAIVTVRPGVTTLLASDIAICKPLPRAPRVFTPSVTAQTIAYNATATVSTETINDPGWPFRLQITAAGRFGNADSGFPLLVAQVNGSDIGRSVGTKLAISGPVPAHLTATSGQLAGRVTVDLLITALAMDSPDQLQLNSHPMNDFVITQIPV